ncbi:MAG: phosphomannomutase [Thermodesulfobacteriota bacterium]
MVAEIPACFKAYDIRGRVPDELGPGLARDIGRAFAACFSPKKVAVGRDIRLSGASLCSELVEGLLESGVDVLDLGLCGTEEIYHAAFSLEDKGVDGGIVVTASHNPSDYNGMKFVTRGAQPVSGDSGLQEMAEMIVADTLPEPATTRGRVTTATTKDDYISHLLSYVKTDGLKPLKLVVNSGNGCAGPVVDLLEAHLPFSFVRMFHEPDGTFPNGVPNPLLPEKRAETGRMVRESGADLGIGWDGDFDRCFFWDENGRFIEGYYIVGLLATALLKDHPGSRILHDPRLVWNTRELVGENGGVPIETRTGHALIKERMREEDALYGGEMSAHHYFRDFGYCDSGMIPWLLVCSLMSRSGKPLARMVDERISAYPVSGEINSTVDDPQAAIDRVEAAFSQGKKEYIDGLSVTFDRFRFNIRQSNTEPLLRLNVESRRDAELMRAKTDELLALIRE